MQALVTTTRRRSSRSSSTALPTRTPRPVPRLWSTPPLWVPPGTSRISRKASAAGRRCRVSAPPGGDDGLLQLPSQDHRRASAGLHLLGQGSAQRVRAALSGSSEQSACSRRGYRGHGPVDHLGELQSRLAVQPLASQHRRTHVHADPAGAGATAGAAEPRERVARRHDPSAPDESAVQPPAGRCLASHHAGNRSG